MSHWLRIQNIVEKNWYHEQIEILCSWSYILPTLYCTFILSYINYGILIWRNTCKAYLDKLFKLQKLAIRTICKSHYRSHTRPLFAKYNVLNAHDMYSLELVVFMYKLVFYQLFTKDIQQLFHEKIWYQQLQDKTSEWSQFNKKQKALFWPSC